MPFNELNTIFNERGLLFVFFGALGAAVRSAALKTTWREGLRMIFIGGACSFGFGAASPHILEKVFGIKMAADVSQAMPGIWASAFVVGLTAITLIEFFVYARNTNTNAKGEANEVE